MRRLNLHSHFLFCMLALGVQSATAAGLMDVYALVTANDAELRVARSAYQATLERSYQGKSVLLPSLDLKGVTTANRQDTDTSFGSSGIANFNSNSVTLSLRQPLYDHDRFAQYRQARHRAEQAEAKYQAAQQATLLRTAEAYFAVLGAADNLAFARAEKTALVRQLDEVTQRFDVGLVAITDVHEVQAVFDLALADLLSAENRLDSRVEALREITVVDAGALNSLREALPLDAPNPEDMSVWEQYAREANPELLAARAAVEIAREDVSRSRAGHFPVLDIVATGARSESGGRFGSSETESQALALEMSLPLFSGGQTQSRVREASHQHDIAVQNAALQERLAVRNVRDAYRGVQSGVLRVKALKQALKSTEVALEAVEVGHEVGTRTIVDVVRARRELFRARRDYAAERYDYLLSWLKLHQVAGRFGESELEAVDLHLAVQAGGHT